MMNVNPDELRTYWEKRRENAGMGEDDEYWTLRWEADTAGEWLHDSLPPKQDTMKCKRCGGIFFFSSQTQIALRAIEYCNTCTESTSPQCPNPDCGGTVVNSEGRQDACNQCSHYTTQR